VTRAVVLELCRELGLAAREISIGVEELRRAQAVFVSLSSVGIAEGASVEGQVLGRSPQVTALHKAYWELVVRETKQPVCLSAHLAGQSGS
jgi:branched-subunit amino acid aminotransferase/4-amino-4-deoxychorismate lyase